MSKRVAVQRALGVAVVVGAMMAGQVWCARSRSGRFRAAAALRSDALHRLRSGHGCSTISSPMPQASAGSRSATSTASSCSLVKTSTGPSAMPAMSTWRSNSIRRRQGRSSGSSFFFPMPLARTTRSRPWCRVRVTVGSAAVAQKQVNPIRGSTPCGLVQRPALAEFPDIIDPDLVIDDTPGSPPTPQDLGSDDRPGPAGLADRLAGRPQATLSISQRAGCDLTSCCRFANGAPHEPVAGSAVVSL